VACDLWKPPLANNFFSQLGYSLLSKVLLTILLLFHTIMH